MNILLDTNILIPLEDTSKTLDSSFAELRKLSAEQHHCLYIHPMQFEDINRDKNQERRTIVLSRLKQYSQIENPPILSDQECNELGLSQSNDNDRVDNNVLFALYRGAVHLLVTNDEGIHRKASKIGLQDKVYRLGQCLLLLQRYTTDPFVFDYTGVKERFLYEINKNQPFFESLRQSYDGFDKWFQKCATDKRKCWCIEDGDSNVVAICIYKHEQDARLTDNGEIIHGRILKLCTFKVDPKARGKKLGERLLYIAFDYCVKNDLDWVYLHTFGEEQKTLVGLCTDYGFSCLGKYKQDDVYIKPMKLRDDDCNSLESLIKYYPYFQDNESVQKFIIPIQPQFHEDLFPDFSNMKGTLFEKDQSLYTCQGNTIKKAYLCHAKIKTIRKGDIILFYRSKDRKSIQCMGIVEDVLFSENIDEVFPAIAKRTVYKYSDIQNILKKRTLVILFRYKALDKEISNQSIVDAGVKGYIQSIRKIDNEQYSALIHEN
ncbi:MULTISPECIES: GNAT family N-acetyltransferase [Bacteroidales]|uniref:GNAT family N-acetyltransferase n=2 Tax=Bacteroidia TaxID=200643 RepID=UPI002658F81F|nr:MULTISPECIES: GNAT family N-acetyltransferase [Bacteroidales]